MKCVLCPAEVELTLLTAAHIVLRFTFVAKKMLPTIKCFGHCWAIPTLLQDFLAKAAQYPLPAFPLKVVCHSCVVVFYLFREFCSLKYSAKNSSHTISLRGWLWWYFPTDFHNLFLWTNFIPWTGHFMQMNSLCFTSSRLSAMLLATLKRTCCFYMCAQLLSQDRAEKQNPVLVNKVLPVWKGLCKPW